MYSFFSSNGRPIERLARARLRSLLKSLSGAGQRRIGSAARVWRQPLFCIPRLCCSGSRSHCRTATRGPNNFIAHSLRPASRRSPSRELEMESVNYWPASLVVAACSGQTNERHKGSRGCGVAERRPLGWPGKNRADEHDGNKSPRQWCYPRFALISPAERTPNCGLLPLEKTLPRWLSLVAESK